MVRLSRKKNWRIVRYKLKNKTEGSDLLGKRIACFFMVHRANRLPKTKIIRVEGKKINSLEKKTLIG